MARHEYMAGMLRVLILSELNQGESYGYGMARGLGKRSGGALAVRAESLYPVLHRMEGEGLCQQRWIEADNGRPRKIYSITPKGRKSWDKTREEFIVQSIAALKVLGVEANVKF
jgi:PadR family transcriptional regulator PadR